MDFTEVTKLHQHLIVKPGHFCRLVKGGSAIKQQFSDVMKGH